MRQIHFLHPCMSIVRQGDVKKFRKLVQYPSYVECAPALAVLARACDELSLPAVKSVTSLVHEFSRREFRTIPFEQFEGQKVYGYVASGEQSRADKAQLLSILRAHNAQFEYMAAIVRERADLVSSIEELPLPKDTWVYVQADIHSDLASLIGVLEMWRRKGLLNEEYRTLANFHLFFLGDYVDRGANDIEVLSLLLAFRMENPENMHLIRGNHEEVALSIQYTSHAAFLLEHRSEFDTCFLTMPFAILAGCQEGHVKPLGNCQRQYVHMSHALFSPGVPIGSFLKGQHSFVCLPRAIAAQNVAPSSSAKTTQACQALFDTFNTIPEALSSDGYIWSDIGEASGPSLRGAGYTLSPEDIFLYRQASSSSSYKVSAFLRGHEHYFRESVVRGKVLATTLPVSRATGFFESNLPLQSIQGVMFSVENRVKDWEKLAILVTIDPETHLPSFEADGDVRTMYESLNEQRPAATSIVEVGTKGDA